MEKIISKTSVVVNEAYKYYTNCPLKKHYLQLRDFEEIKHSNDSKKKTLPGRFLDL
jgi:hypothetical protein